MTIRLFLFAAVVLGGVLMPTAPKADGATAILEDIVAKDAAFRPFDFLEPGQKIVLKSGETAVIGYLANCRRETIQGGTVVIGDTKSAVSAGRLRAEIVECDGGKMDLSPDYAAKSAVTVVRAPPTKGPSKHPPRPQLTVYSASPVVVPPRGADAVTFRRLDRPAQPLAVPIENGTADLAKRGAGLDPGGTYAVEAGDRTAVVLIDPLAEAGPGPVLSRLIRF